MVAPSPSIFPKKRPQNRVEGTKYAWANAHGMSPICSALLFSWPGWCSRELWFSSNSKKARTTCLVLPIVALVPSSSIGIVLSNPLIYSSISESWCCLSEYIWIMKKSISCLGVQEGGCVSNRSHRCLEWQSWTVFFFIVLCSALA